MSVRMRWRLVVVALVALTLLDALSGVIAYGSNTWNWNHTEVLTGWAAVREVCLVFFPFFVGSFGLLVAVLLLGVLWVVRGSR